MKLQPFRFRSSKGIIAGWDSGGKGRPVVLLHGLPTSKELFSNVIPLLKPGLRIIAFDLNNYGESEKTGFEVTHHERAHVLEELRAFLKLQRFSLAAHDLGSSVAVDYMGRYGAHVQRLALMSAPVYPDFRVPLIVRLARLPVLGTALVFLFRRLLLRIGLLRGLVKSECLTPHLMDAFASGFDGPHGLQTLMCNLRWGRPQFVFRDYPSTLRTIRIPTLILHGSNDPYIPSADAERLAHDIKGARLTMIQGGKHFLPLDYPHEVAEALNMFL
ncbi:MAG: alpha/beta hydrolase [Spirochaetia bacterium]|nr:alpha/beta hydrolase [Spirochaetia bacterium]